MTKVHYRGFVNYNYYVVIVLVSFIITSSVLHVVMSIFDYIKIFSLHALVVTHDQSGDTFSLIFYREPFRTCETCV